MIFIYVDVFHILLKRRDYFFLGFCLPARISFKVFQIPKIGKEKSDLGSFNGQLWHQQKFCANTVKANILMPKFHLNFS